MTPRRSQRTQKEKLTDRKIGVKVAVARDFETGIGIGQVTDVTVDDSGDVFYNIKYEDGDGDDFDERQLQEGVSLYHRTQKEKLGIKIAKYFNMDIFIGEVKKIFHDSGDVFYNIEYEDGDGEDFDEKELQEGIALYQHTQKEKLGIKVAKRFDMDIFIGEVKHVIHDSGVLLYTIEYEDGDGEDFDEKELQEGIALYQHTQKEKLGAKVAKRFDTDVFIGEVEHVIHDSGVLLYTIEYEDGDGEDFDEKELQEGIALYEHTQKQQKRTRKHLTKKKVRTNQSVHRPKRKRDTSHSVGAL